MPNALIQVTTFIGSDLYSFSSESVVKPKKRKYLVGVFDFGSSLSGGDIRHFYLSIEDGNCILWDVMVDSDINRGKPMYAMVAMCRDYRGRKNREISFRLVLESLRRESELYSLVCVSGKLMKAGLMLADDFVTLIEALNE